MKNQFTKRNLTLSLLTFALMACSKNDAPDTPPIDPALEGQFLIATTVTSGASSATYLLNAESLDDDKASITTIGNGLEYSETFSNYMSNGYEGFVAINYNKGNAHLGQRFTINEQGKPANIGAQFELTNGFTTAGIVGNEGVTIMSGGRAADITIATINRIPMSQDKPTYASLKVNNFAGFEGKNAGLIGVADAHDGSFYTSIEYSGDQLYNVAVAKVDVKTLKPTAIYTDTRLGISGAFYRSARYSQIGTAANGDVFIFSGNNHGKKNAGALVLRKGAKGFDANYYWDIETASGGYRFRNVWHVKDDKFLLEFYNAKYQPDSSPGRDAATQFAIVDMSDKRLTWVTGIPAKSEIPDLGVSAPYVFKDQLYLGIQTSSEEPRFYSINPETAVGKKGLLVKNATNIEAATFVAKK